MARVFVALGGNVGDVLASFRMALAALEAEVGAVVKVSSAYRSVAAVLDAQPSPDYWNAVCELRSELAPVAVLDRLKGIERRAGRKDDGVWRPRPLDLDLLLWGEQTVETPRLQVPHARLRERMFVLQPLCELEPTLPLPPDGQSVGAVLGATQWPWDGILAQRGAWWHKGMDVVGQAIEDAVATTSPHRGTRVLARDDAQANGVSIHVSTQARGRRGARLTSVS